MRTCGEHHTWFTTSWHNKNMHAVNALVSLCGSTSAANQHDRARQDRNVWCCAGNMIGPSIDWSQEVLPASGQLPAAAAVAKPGMGMAGQDEPDNKYLGGRGTGEQLCTGPDAQAGP